MHPKDLSISDFTYDLPEDRVAKYPLEERDSSKLLVFKNEVIATAVYSDLDQFLPDGTLLVFNNTRVIEARILFQKPTGGVIEIFCLEPDDKYSDITSAMLQKGKVSWKCLIGGASKWKHGMVLKKNIKLNEGKVILEASIVNRLSDCFVVELSWQPEDLSFAELLHIAGIIPLPPYFHREAEDEDRKRYQTVYANNDGSVAAPTAGLHFTEAIFNKLSVKNIQKEFVTLHVGAGTFKPVKAETLEEHEMHAEFIEVSAENIDKLVEYLDKTIVAVGTTSLRTIESLYWMGVKATIKPEATIDEISIRQWDPYDIQNQDLPAKDALTGLKNWMERNHQKRLITKTQILIAPGYSLKIAKGIITNFHQPQSTLLLLVAAIVGNEWKKIYEYALKNGFRFLSYGDGCLLWVDTHQQRTDS
jgi:S-adenosylmethionine:tRNA ribosyltransferase-isomerase